MINVSEFHKAYDRHIAVRGLTFQVEPGQILGLVGPNGAGKTSTLRALTGIIPASRGPLAICSTGSTRNRCAAKRAWDISRTIHSCSRI